MLSGRTCSSFSSRLVLLTSFTLAIVLVLTTVGCGGVASNSAVAADPGSTSSGTGNSGGNTGGGSNPPPSTAGAIVNWHYNTARTGANDQETLLNVNSVSSSGFGQLFSYPVDGEVFAQPLYVPGMTINGAKHNVVFIATEHDSVYAFDADAPGSPLWKASLLVPNSTTVPNINVNDPGGRTSLGDEVGITGTPVIDLDTNTMYVSAMTWENGTAVHRLHALDTTTGKDKLSPVIETATVPGTGVDSVNGQVTFEPTHLNQRPGLVLAEGMVFVEWGSFSDVGQYHGWVMAYDKNTLKQVAVLNTTPDNERGSIWQAGGAPPVDTDGTIYIATADGINQTEGGPNWSNSLLRLKVSNGQFQITDWFTPHNEYCLAVNDMDFGSGVAVLLPDGSSTIPLLAIGTKEGELYLMNRSHLGNFMSGTDNVVQEILFSPTHCDTNVKTQYDTRRIYGAPAFWNKTLYFGMAHANMVAYKLSGGQLVAASQSSDSFAERGPIPVVSANGNTDGIVWIADYNTSTHHTTLKAYDATDLGHVLFSEDIGAGETFTVPLVINSKVYVAKQGAVLVYGLK